MGFIDKIKEKVAEMTRARAEKAEFKKYAEQQTLPLRRQGYLQERMKQAVEEGKLIAKAEFEKSKQKIEPPKPVEGSQFGLPNQTNLTNQNQHIKMEDPFKFLQPQNQTKPTKLKEKK